MFLCAQPVWLTGLDDEMNITAAFSLQAGRLTGVTLPVSYTHLTLPTNREV